MGKRFLRSIVSDFQTLTASADITPVDLPVNPLSCLYLSLKATKNVAAQATNLGRLMMPIIQQITDLSVRKLGEQIIQGTLDDLAVLNAVLHGQSPSVHEGSYADNAEQVVTIPLSFSRRPFWPEEGLAAAKRGELRFHMTAGALPTGYDAVAWALEAVELIEDEPMRSLKYTTNTRAIVATGRQKVPLPIGHEILGVLLFDPSDETDATNAYAWGKVMLLKDNVQQYYVESNWESLREAMERRCGGFLGRWGHQHGQAAADTNVGEEMQIIADRAPLQYGYLDFDPRDDGYFALDTLGASDLDLDLNSDVSTGSVRYLPVELRKNAAAA